RLGAAGRSEPPQARGPRARCRPQPADRRLPARVRPERLVLRVDRSRPPRPRSSRAVVGIEARFGHGPPPLTLGVEEELVVLDAETLAQVGRGPELVAALGERDLPGRAKTELHASVFELNTEPCARAEQVLEALRVLRAEAASAAADLGLAIAATGTHPFSRAAAQPIVEEARYRTMVEHHGLSACRPNVQGVR